MSKEEPWEIAQIYKILGHPCRKKIIEIIAEKEKRGFKELRESLNISVGAFYYHIDILSDLIKQDEQKKYVLTERGKLAYDFLKNGGEQLSAFSLTENSKPKKRYTLYKIQQLILPGKLFHRITNKPIHYLPITAIIIALGILITAQANLKFTLIFPENAVTASTIEIAANFVASWLILFGLCDLLAIGLFKRKGGDLSLLVASSFSFLPLILFSGLLYSTSFFDISLPNTEASLLLIIFQAWTITIMSTAISLSKGLNIEKAALITIVSAYINIAYTLFTQIY